MASSTPQFDPEVFRTNIHFAMTMGQPTNVPDQVTFRWSPTKTGTGPSDPGGVPYDLTQPATIVNPHPDVVVPCAVRFTPGAIEDTPIGEMDPTKMVLTLLDVDFAQVIGADTVLYGQHPYSVDFVAPPLGLFQVTVYEIYCRSIGVGPHAINND